MAGLLRKAIGIFLIIFGVILLAVFIIDDITVIGIFNNIIPITLIGYGVVTAFPFVKLPLGGRGIWRTVSKYLGWAIVGLVVAFVLALVLPTLLQLVW
ncbi:MAG: hypothetical protein ACXADB_08890 [Candidatus Hermodarchaeia archaeon]|jgi:hypothetical protein